jgi:hypothetical protein
MIEAEERQTWPTPKGLKMNTRVFWGFIGISIAITFLTISNNTSFEGYHSSTSPFGIINLVLWFIGALFWFWGWYLITVEIGNKYIKTEKRI